MYKRLYRQANDDAKRKMSQAHQGRTPSELTKERISQSMKKYWETVPDKDEYLSMHEFLGIRDEKEAQH